MPKLNRLLLTGAAGGVGKAIRPFLSQLAEQVLLSDLQEITDLAPHETFRAAQLGDRAQVDALFAEPVDGVIHLGGVSVEKPFAMICEGNLVGAYNIFDAVRLNGKPRLIFASSNHVTGYYRRDETVGADVMLRPDSLYGASKAWGEALSSVYYDKFGVETLCVRIGYCFPRPESPRQMALWLAAEDFIDLCARAFDAEHIGRAIIYGVSDNDDKWVDNSGAAFLGWKPKHSSAQWRADVLANTPKADPLDPALIYQGGPWVHMGHPDD
ncbi:MAG: NAD(P)-dependent oxidoreductase [Neomegalonema sp.]|nr:NAD(P)-dependent oxidoreductase [Neomegalonema sp.]